MCKCFNIIYTQPYIKSVLQYSNVVDCKLKIHGEAIFSLVALRERKCLLPLATDITAGLRAAVIYTKVKTGLGCLHGEGWENTMTIYGGCLHL